MLVGLEAGNEVGGSPDRRSCRSRQATSRRWWQRVCARVPWMAERHAAHGRTAARTASRPTSDPILGPAGPLGFYLACGFSGTGFKTAPAVGACLAELILDGRATTVDISAYGLDRFAAGRLLVGEHPYGHLWE